MKIRLLGQLQLPGVLASVGVLAEFLEGIADQASLSSKAKHALMLAADEITTNIVEHGEVDALLSSEIEIRAETDERSVYLTIIDNSGPFDPRARPEPDDLLEPLEVRQPGGLGIFLTLLQVDEFHYERLDNRNVNRLCVHRQTLTPD